jgi:hypothetical protein
MEFYLELNLMAKCVDKKSGKGKAKLTLCLIKYYAMKTYGEWSYSSTILDLGTKWR